MWTRLRHVRARGSFCVRIAGAGMGRAEGVFGARLGREVVLQYTRRVLGFRERISRRLRFLLRRGRPTPSRLVASPAFSSEVPSMYTHANRCIFLHTACHGVCQRERKRGPAGHSEEAVIPKQL
jgi:hypothetical protein